MKRSVPDHIIPAGAASKPWDKIEPLFDNDNWYAEPKLDGWRFLLHYGGGLDRVYLTGRNVTKDGTLSERGLHVDIPRPRGKIGYTVLDGEMMPPPGASFRDINGIMGKITVEKAAARIEEIGHPIFNVFDCLSRDGEKVVHLPQDHRRSIAKALVATGFSPGKVTLVPMTRVNIEGFYQDIITAGGEGIILKDKTAAMAKVGSR